MIAATLARNDFVGSSESVEGKHGLLVGYSDDAHPDKAVAGLGIGPGERLEVTFRASRQVLSVAVFGGGIIPAEDIEALKARGVKALFTPGTSTQDIIRFVRDNIRATI